MNRDFGIFDSLSIYRREVQQGSQAPGTSRFTWNEVLFRSFQAGYLKQLDWGLYTRLKSPVAKRLYRFLDKRFYRGNTVEIDLRELAFRKIRLSESYNVAQMKRVLLKGIEELQSEWDLKTLPNNRQFEKYGKGTWIVRFERKPKRRLIEEIKSAPVVNLSPIDPMQLEYALTKRGVGPATANELSEQFPTQSVQTMIELFDWYNNRNQPRGAGFLVQAIKNPSSISMPHGFQNSFEIADKRRADKGRKAAEQAILSQRERRGHQREESRLRRFTAFWKSLSPKLQDEFENEAVDQAQSTKREGYYRAQGKGGRVFEHYQTVILRDHFERLNGINQLSLKK